MLCEIDAYTAKTIRQCSELLEARQADGQQILNGYPAASTGILTDWQTRFGGRRKHIMILQAQLMDVAGARSVTWDRTE